MQFKILSTIFMLIIFGECWSQNDMTTQGLNKRNVIMVIVDDLNDWISGYNGHPNSLTPNINRLVEKGTLFSNAWPTVPWCNPSRVSILTGVHPINSGIVSLQEYPFREHLPNAITLQEAFRENGYFNKGIGKIFHYDDNYSEVWDEYDAFRSFPKPKNLPGHGNESIIALAWPTRDWGAVDQPIELWGDHKKTMEAVNFFKGLDESSNPFFLSLGYHLPHLPWYYPEQFDDFLSNQEIEIPKDSLLHGINTEIHNLIKDNNLWPDAVKSYLATIHFIDYNLGLLLDEVESNPLLSSSIIVLTSDHGFHLGEKGRWEKVTMWNESLRTPLIIHDPSLPAAPKSISASVSLMDIYPTLLDLCDIKGNKFIDGKSLRNHLSSEKNIANEFNLALLPKNGQTIGNQESKFVKLKNFEGVFNLKEDFSELNPNTDIDVIEEYKIKMDSILAQYILYTPLSIPKIHDFSQTVDSFVVELIPETEREAYEIYITKDTTSNAYALSLLENTIFKYKKDTNTCYLKIRSFNPKYSSSWTKYYKIPCTEKIILSREHPFQLDIYPNPTTDFMKFTGNKVIDGYYTILSSAGKIVASGEIGGNEIDVRNIATGLYFLTVETSTDTIVKKFLKK